MSLPDNVTVNTEYVVRSTDDAEVFNDITVTRGERGNVVYLKQDSDTVALIPADVPGLIAALQALAGIPVPQDPAEVIDNDGERWYRVAPGRYTCEGHEACNSLEIHAGQSLDAIRERYGIREEG